MLDCFIVCFIVCRAFEKLVLGRITKGWEVSGHPELDDAMMRLPGASYFIQ